MLTITTSHPTACAICGDYLTSSERYAGQRCLDPAHWQAAGVLASTDYYAMARIAALSQAELDRGREAQRKGEAQRPGHRSKIRAGWQRSVSWAQDGWPKNFGETPA